MKRKLDSLEISGEIIQHVRSISPVGSGEILIRPETSLIEEGIVDSLGIIALITHLEQKYQINFTEDDMLSDDIATPLGLAQSILKKL